MRLDCRVGWAHWGMVVALLACAIGRAGVARAEEKPAAGWINVTANVGGEKWGYAGVTLLAAVPGSGDVIAGVSEAGLWSSDDAGKIWKKLGKSDAVQIQSRPYQILFDPNDAKVFYVSGSYKGPGIFRTNDAGQTFQPLDAIAHVDGLGVDFTDPGRKTLLVGHHEKDHALEKSSDAGKSWQNIGDKLPPAINFSNNVIVIDAKTFVVNAAGWEQDKGMPLAFGVYRTIDGGATWTKVFDGGPDGPPCITADGTIFWQTLWGAGLIKSADKGATWQRLGGPVKTNPVEMPGGKLAAPVEKQLYVSADAGKTWAPLGPELPFKPTGIVVSAKGRAIYAWRSTEAKEDNVVSRWEMPMP